MREHTARGGPAPRTRARPHLRVAVTQGSGIRLRGSGPLLYPPAVRHMAEACRAVPRLCVRIALGPPQTLAPWL